MPISLSRRIFAQAAAAAAGLSAVPLIGARAATYTLRLGCDITEDHPIGSHLIAAAKSISKATNGEVDIQVFLNNQLGEILKAKSPRAAGIFDIDRDFHRAGWRLVGLAE